MSDAVASLVPGKTDAEKAKAYRAELGPVLEQVAEMVNRAARDGLVLGFNMTRDQFGIMRTGEILVTKPL